MKHSPRVMGDSIRRSERIYDRWPVIYRLPESYAITRKDAGPVPSRRVVTKTSIWTVHDYSTDLIGSLPHQGPGVAWKYHKT